jgi:Ca-activated chloride channel family protein
MRTLALAALALVLGTGAAAAGSDPMPSTAPVVITGRVTDAASGAPLRGAQIYIERTERGTLSDADGRYRLELPGVAPGTRLSIRAVLIGYAPQTRRVVAAAEPVQLDFALRTMTLSLEEVTVTTNAAQARQLRAAPAAASIGWPGRVQDWNTEAYDKIDEHGFVAVTSKPLSTFSIDVDRASYSNVRRFLDQGQLPPIDAVRIEELINYFPYAYPAPRGEHPVAVVTEVAPAPWQPAHRLLRIGLQAPRVEMRDLPPSNLVFLIDVSGSMYPANKLPLLKRSLRLLVEQLRPEDRVAIVVYAGAAGLVLPSTPGSERGRIMAAIEELEAGGSTAGGAGLRLAYDVARESHIASGNNRIILATDGDFNIGVSSDAEMVRLVEEKRRQGTFLTVLGFGMGNLKDAKMEKLADHGNGNYAYIDSELEARKVLVHEMGGTLHTVAKDVKLQVEFNPARVRAYRLIGYENRALADHEFDDDRKDAGDLGAGHSVTALYEIVPVGAQSPVRIGETAPLRYQQPARPSRAAGAGDELAYVRIRYKRPDGEQSRLLEHAVADHVGEPSADLRFAAAVTAFGMTLRGSEHRGSASFAQAAELARGALGDDPHGYRADFVRLVQRAQELRRAED